MDWHWNIENNIEIESDMKTYTIVGGVNGTGKSSLVGVLKCQKDVIVDDNCITALEQIHDCFAKNVSFMHETTLSGHKTEAIVAKAKEQNYYIRLFYVGLNTLGECLARIENRVKRGGHNIPANDVCRTFESRWDELKNVLPYCDEAYFLDNDNGFVEVAEYRNGEVLSIGELRPDWLMELQCFLIGKRDNPAMQRESTTLFLP